MVVLTSGIRSSFVKASRQSSKLIEALPYLFLPEWLDLCFLTLVSMLALGSAALDSMSKLSVATSTARCQSIAIVSPHIAIVG